VAFRKVGGDGKTIVTQILVGTKKVIKSNKRRFQKMRMLIDFNLPLEPFNTLVRNGTVGQKIQEILEEIKPEAVTFQGVVENVAG
jgi:hypothetical protein